MNRAICQVISDEDIYVNINNLSSTSSKQNKSVNLKYESVIIDEKIAQGGYGTVYKAHSYNKQYALKKLCVNNQENLLICIKEIYILKNMHSDYILHFIDSIIYQTETDIFEVYILTDFYPGDLSTEMKTKCSSNEAFEERDILRIINNIAEAIASLHHFLSTPIIHRDLKVENILVGYPTRYVLCDFGSATLKEVRPCDVNRQELQDEISQYTTMAYRSPEMADLYFESGKHIIGRKSDIWAMGVMMYNICFFSLPFCDSVLSVLSGQFTVPDNHFYSDNLMKAIKYCLTINPLQRPDIYQLSSILFSLAGRPNPVKNYEKSLEPNLETLSMPMKDSDSKYVNTNRKQKNINKNIINQPISTSIKPRVRPKPGGKSNKIISSVKPDSPDLKDNESIKKNDLLILESPSENPYLEANNFNQINKIKSIDEFDKCNINNSFTQDLMDFQSPDEYKIKHLVNLSQSHGQNFTTFEHEKRFQANEMISHSYQNVSHLQHQMYNNPISFTSSFTNNFPIRSNNPFYTNHRTAVPINYTTNYCQNDSQAAQIGHRRMISDPSAWHQPVQNSSTSNNVFGSGILQPTKIPMKTSVMNVLENFDPLAK